MTPQEWAEQTVRVVKDDTSPPPSSGGPYYCIHVGEWRDLFSSTSQRGSLEREVREMRKAVADAVRSAVAEALSAGLPGAPLDAGQLEEIEARAGAASPGPWSWNGELAVWSDGKVPGVDPGQGVDVAGVYGDGHGLTRTTGEANAAFIAHARQDVPDLLAHVAFLEGLLRDVAQDGTLVMYGKGYGKGYEAGRAAVDASV